MKKTLSLLLALILVLTAVCIVTTASANTSVMYVKTPNGKSVNVRSAPSKSAEIIGSAGYGHSVLTDWSYAGNDGWTRVVWGSLGDGYIMTQFLTATKPDPYKPSKKQEEQDKKNEQKAEQDKLKKEQKSERTVEQYYIVIQPTRSSGWVNFRSGPSKTTSRVASFAGGKELIVNGETDNWYRAQDPETGKTGYIHKNYATKISKQIATEAGDGTEKLGTLSVNGEFELTCRLPEDYKLQVVNTRGESIIASVLSDDMTKPQMYLSIAYDETYSDVKRMNDLGEEDLLILENSFTEMNDVAITYGETGHGTKLLIARETGSDTDFVDILGIYNGYFIEFNMSPNPKASAQTLTDEQILMCIDFLTDVQFEAIE